MTGADDLAPEALAGWLGDRPVRSYAALLSTEAAAGAWARAGAPHGAVVVADYQVSARGHGGRPWTVRPGRDLGLTVVVRPDLPVEREGWPCLVALLAVAEVLGPTAGFDWPDTIVASDGRTLARLGVHADLGPAGVSWVGLSVLVVDVVHPRAELLARVLDALHRRLDEPTPDVLAAARERCRTFGATRRALLVPVGPGGPEITGEAVDLRDDGALVLQTSGGRRVAVRPQALGRFDEPARDLDVPAEVTRRLTRRPSAGRPGHELSAPPPSPGPAAGPPPR